MANVRKKAAPKERIDLSERLRAKLLHNFSVQPEAATNENFYHALALVLRDLMRTRRLEYIGDCYQQQSKQVYYLCMEFLMGRSLKNTLYNLNLTEEAERVLSSYGVKLDALYELAPDAGLGNGGLGRLAACFLDGLATKAIPAMGYSLLYEYGIFRQKLVDGWQTELPDCWLPGGESWLLPRPELSKEVRFDGEIREWWDSGYHHVEHKNATVVVAQAYDLMVAGKDGRGISTLRLWKATAPGMDMTLFNQGEYMRAMEQKAMAEVITQVLYPADNHREGKSLRLSQQYFLVSASIQDIVRRHLEQYDSLDTLPDMAAIHINDTHPTLAIPELMRILLDECGYGWDAAWDIVTRCVAYTNHTVMAEALEKWSVKLFRSVIPQVYRYVMMLQRSLLKALEQKGITGQAQAPYLIMDGSLVHMARMAVYGSHAVNGVAQIHTEILKKSVLKEWYQLTPEKFQNKTNGITQRKWLLQCNPALSRFITERIGSGWITHLDQLKKMERFQNDPETLRRFGEIKRRNKQVLADYIEKVEGVTVSPDFLFDVQAKRLHEYKRQLLNAFSILDIYYGLKEGRIAGFTPTLFLFGAKAAPGYFRAKGIIKYISEIAKLIDGDPAVRGRMQVLFLTNYGVSYAEKLMPAAEISEQISTAGTEASGTSNMNFMLNGAVTLGTYDGANIEIVEQAGEDNNYIFGARIEEIEKIRESYDPVKLYQSNPRLRRAVDSLVDGTFSDGGTGMFRELYDALLKGASWHQPDHYFLLKDFDSYQETRLRANREYQNPELFYRKCYLNMANAGKFSSDRTIRQYYEEIWSNR